MFGTGRNGEAARSMAKAGPPIRLSRARSPTPWGKQRRALHRRARGWVSGKGLRRGISSRFAVR